MSGIASDAWTIPGSVATFASCSSERSRWIADRSSKSANTRAGTRMSGRALAGISQSSSSIRRIGSSDIEHHRSSVPGVRRLERQPVVGHRLDDRRGLSVMTLDHRLEGVRAELELPERNRLERVDLGTEHELLEPCRKQRRTVGSGRLDGSVLIGIALDLKQLDQRRERIGEDLALGRRLDRDFEFARVLDPSVHPEMDGRAGSAPTIARCHTWSVEASAARARSARTADPWRDTEVIDERAPRFNQAVVGTVALLGAAFGWPLAWALMAAQLFIGLTLGRRFCIPCVAYFELVQPRVGEGELEDSRPPRLANVIGTVFLAGAAAAWWLGAPIAGTVLGSIVAAL